MPQIVDEVFADHEGAGTLVPEWRGDLVDSEVYPRRTRLCIQCQESDLAFVLRLMRE